MKFHVKNNGSILLPTVIVSGMILALALALTKIVSSELQFATDLLLSERAYFAAESGVETALLSLKDEPINYVNITDAPLTDDPEESILMDVFVDNSKTEFGFSIDPKTAVRWRLGVDTDDTDDVAKEHVKTFEIEIASNNYADLQWKIQCEADNGKTKMLQERASESSIDGDTTGVYDQVGYTDEDTTITEFLESDNINEAHLCFITLTNFGNANIKVTVTSDEEISPAQTFVRATGKAGGRKKIITFQYQQKALNPFFDFGLLHQN